MRRGARLVPLGQHAPGTRSYLKSEQSLRVAMETLELYCLYLRGPLNTDGRGGYMLCRHRWRRHAARRWGNYVSRRGAEGAVTLLHQLRDLLRLKFAGLLLDLRIPNLLRYLNRETPGHHFLACCSVCMNMESWRHSLRFWIFIGRYVEMVYPQFWFVLLRVIFN